MAHMVDQVALVGGGPLLQKHMQGTAGLQQWAFTQARGRKYFPFLFLIICPFAGCGSNSPALPSCLCSGHGSAVTGWVWKMCHQGLTRDSQHADQWLVLPVHAWDRIPVAHLHYRF